MLIERMKLHGQRVSTQVHAVKTIVISHVGDFFIPPSITWVQGFDLPIRHPPSELMGVHDRPLSCVFLRYLTWKVQSCV
jgi:hypothetical protein